MWWSLCIQNGLTSRSDFHLFKCILRTVSENHPNRGSSVVAAVRSVLLGRRVRKFSFRLKGRSRQVDRTLSMTFFYSKNLTILLRDVRLLSTGWGEVTSRGTESKIMRSHVAIVASVPIKCHHALLPIILSCPLRHGSVFYPGVFIIRKCKG